MLLLHFYLMIPTALWEVSHSLAILISIIEEMLIGRKAHHCVFKDYSLVS